MVKDQSLQEKIALYYAFAPLADPEAVRLWQQNLCERLGLKGRIIVSKHGINGTVGGPLAGVKQYVKQTRSYPGFSRMDVKYSDGGAEDFPRLSVKNRPEIVAFGAPDELVVDEHGVVGGGKHLKPEALHELVAERQDAGEEVVFFDGRNAFEAQIGKFKNAVVPETQTTRDFIEELDSGKYDHLKDRAVVTYCTGGIRCEVLSSLMVNRGFKDVYQLDGGIVRYGETFGDSGLWEGSLYVFDRRMSVDFTPEAREIGQCVLCEASTSRLANCPDPGCRTLQPYCAEHEDPSGRQVCEPCRVRAAA